MTTEITRKLQDACWERGTTPRQWALDNGFTPKTVREVYEGEVNGKPIRGLVATRIRRKLNAFLKRPVEGVDGPMPHGPVKVE